MSTNHTPQLVWLSPLGKALGWAARIAWAIRLGQRRVWTEHRDARVAKLAKTRRQLRLAIYRPDSLRNDESFAVLLDALVSGTELLSDSERATQLLQRWCDDRSALDELEGFVRTIDGETRRLRALRPGHSLAMPISN
jgi:hypothetical protein